MRHALTSPLTFGETVTIYKTTSSLGLHFRSNDVGTYATLYLPSAEAGRQRCRDRFGDRLQVARSTRLNLAPQWIALAVARGGVER